MEWQSDDRSIMSVIMRTTRSPKKTALASSAKTTDQAVVFADGDEGDG